MTTTRRIFSSPSERQRAMKAAVQAAMALKASTPSTPFSSRSITNTLPRPRLGNKEATVFCKKGALYFYDDANKGSGKAFRYPQLSWLSLALMTTRPDLEQRGKLTRKEVRPFTKVLGEMSQSFTESGAAALTSVRKVDDAWEVTVPFALVQIAHMALLPQLLTNQNPDDAVSPTSSPIIWPTEPDADGIMSRTVKASQLKPTGGMFHNKALEQLKSIPGASITIRPFYSGYVFLLTLQFSRAECEFMTNSNWLEIRPLDMYGMARAWADSRLGAQSRPPRSSVNLQVIAETIPADSKPITSTDYSILIDEGSEYWWVPPAVQDIRAYESEMSSSYSQDDGSFSAYSFKEAKMRQGPKARVILTDWANLKLSYSDKSGKLHVKSLDRSITPNGTHYRRMLDMRIDTAVGLNLLSLALSMGRLAGYDKVDDIVNQAPLKRLSETVLREGQDFQGGDYQRGDSSGLELEGFLPEDMRIIHLYELKNVSAAAHLWFGLLEKLAQVSKDAGHLPLLYTEYSVPSVSRVMALALILVHSGPNYAVLMTEDNQARKVYTEQDKPLPPDYVPQSVPYMSEGRGMMPHQRRVTGKLASSPDFVVLPVAAGGGKTMIAVYDVLKEMANSTSKRFLIMCPSHLVGQYVKEFVYFTDGRLNVLAVNAYTLKRHGIEGLAKLLSSAPVNTVVVTDYNIALGESRSFRTGYGTAVTKVFPVVEMLRSFVFDYVFMDESHMLKGSTGRQAAVARLVTPIKKKRMASGTLTPDSLMDLVKQVSLLDPTIFGSKAEFIEKYALEMRGEKVTQWKPTAARDIMAELKARAVWAPAKRKEWAACLPSLVEEAVTVQMTPRQQLVYQTVLESVVATIQEEMKSNKALLQALTQSSEEGAESTGDDEEEADPVDLDKLLKPFLQRLEQFVTAPAADELGSRMLTGEDLVSPKVHAVIKIIRDHLESGTPGKILIFTNYTASAEAIYESLPPDLKAKTIHYKAAEKAEHGALFETNPDKMVMVGVETSMNTGLNLQFCSRLIRIDSVWTPGALEQGNSRIGRPNIKVAETRTKVFINWVVMDRSIDITKMAYLFAKRVTIGLFEESGNPLYDGIEPPPLFAMTLDTIASSNERTSDMLTDYYSAYAAFKQAEGRDFADYRRTHPEDLDENGKLKMTPLQRAPNLPGSSLMYRVPYVPGMEIYKGEDLGLVRYDQLLQLDSDLLEDDETDDDDDGIVTIDPNASPEEQRLARRQASRAASQAELAKVQHLSVHCEYGDCEIVSVSRKQLRVRDSTGTTHKINKLTAFVITRAQTNHSDMRSEVLKMTGDIPFDAPSVLAVKNPRSIALPSGKAKATPDSNVISVVLDMVVMNDFVGLEMNNVSTNLSGARALQGVGFKQPQPYAYALMPTADHMFKQFAKWHDAGFKIRKEYNQSCRNLYTALKNSRSNAKSYVGLATSVELQNFFRMHVKPVSDLDTLCPYPMVWNDQVYLCLPLSAHPASLKAMQSKVAGVTWNKAKVDDTLSVFMPSLNSFDRNMHALLETGLVVSNIKDLIRVRKRLQRRSPALVKGLQK